MWVCVCVHVCFKELVHVFMESGKSKSAGLRPRRANSVDEVRRQSAGDFSRAGFFVVVVVILGLSTD